MRPHVTQGGVTSGNLVRLDASQNYIRHTGIKKLLAPMRNRVAHEGQQFCDAGVANFLLRHVKAHQVPAQLQAAPDAERAHEQDHEQRRIIRGKSRGKARERRLQYEIITVKDESAKAEAKPGTGDCSTRLSQ